MKLHHFVSGSSVVLAGWLAATFVYHVPAQRYQRPDRFPTAAASLTGTGVVAASCATDPAVFSVSASR